MCVRSREQPTSKYFLSKQYAIPTFSFFLKIEWHQWKLESLSKWKICIWKTGKIINSANMRSVHFLNTIYQFWQAQVIVRI